MPPKKREALKSISKQSLISMPLSPQMVSSLKKRAKTSSETAAEILKELVPIVGTEQKKSQLTFIHQIIMVCLGEIRDFSVCNKASLAFLSRQLHLEAYAVLGLQHALLGSKSVGTTLKTPNASEGQELLRVTKKATAHPSVIITYLINVVRVLIGLDLFLKISFYEELQGSDGLLYWLQRLESFDKDLHQKMAEHSFRLLFSTLTQYPLYTGSDGP
jgi:hypothetical protein